MNDLIFRLLKLKKTGFCCAQIILILGLEAQGKTNIELVRSVGGLCFGINGSGEVCGALSGGACLISLYAGQGSDEEVPHDMYPKMMGELVEWFRGVALAEYGGTRCNEILERYPDRSICGRIVAETYGKCMDILMSHGIVRTVKQNG